jgi:hypothetical protein
LAFDHEEMVRNRKLAEHSMRARRKQDAGLKAGFAREEKAARAQAAELDLFTEMMETG